MHRRLVFAAEERTRMWRHMVNLPVLVLLGGRSRDSAPDGGVASHS